MSQVTTSDGRPVLARASDGTTPAQCDGRCRQPVTDAQTVAGSDPNGYVTAIVRPDGYLDGIHINPHAMYDLTAAELSRACTAAVQAASSRPAAQSTERH
jgi:DNA-binding protein YbaB